MVSQWSLQEKGISSIKRSGGFPLSAKLFESMNYSQSLAYLNSFINYERIILNASNRDLNLKRMRFLMDLFKIEKPSFFPILIAGTKGKGSCGFMLESILNAAGYKTGFYSSPHLETPRERIRINGRMITAAEWSKGICEIQNKLRTVRWPKKLGELTYFEILTFLAILTFHKRGVDAGIMEVGLGGRLDATNVLDAKLCLLTTIGFDHEQFLGNTLTLIAREKAAVMRSGGHAAVSPQIPEAMQAIASEARRIGAMLHRSHPPEQLPGLEGRFQQINAGTVLSAVGVLQREFGFQISRQAVNQGLKARSWPGRFERIRKGGLWILDAAHNPAAIAAVTSEIARLKGFRRKIVLFAVARDKKAQEMLKSLSTCFDEAVLVQTGDSRARSAGELAVWAAPFFKKIYPLGDVRRSFDFLKEQSEKGTLILVTGSFHLAGAVRTLLTGKKIR